MITRRVGFLALAGVAVLTLAACSSSARSTLPARSLSIELTEFSVNPNTYSAHVGEPLTLAVTNKGVLDHDVTILGQDGQTLAHVAVKSNQTASIDFQPLAAGQLQILCSIKGHAKAGMTAQMLVNP